MLEIKLDLVETRSAARTLNEEAGNIKKICDSLRKNKNNVLLSWQGECAAEFDVRFESWLKETKKLTNELETIAAQITKEANEYEAAEKRVTDKIFI